MIKLNSDVEYSSMFGLLPDAISLILRLIKFTITIAIVPSIIWVTYTMVSTPEEHLVQNTEIPHAVTVESRLETPHAVTVESRLETPHAVTVESRLANTTTQTTDNTKVTSDTKPTEKLKIEVSKQITPLEIEGNTITTPNGILYLEQPLAGATTDDVIYFFRFSNGKDTVCAGSQLTDTNCVKVTNFRVSDMSIDIVKKIEILQTTSTFVQTKNGIVYINEPLKVVNSDIYYMEFTNNSRYLCPSRQFKRSACSSIKKFVPNN